ncbi:MAG: tryptophan 7-halogenase [Proteobacteria bacterium]|nr:tryptophan 7-halogenase [Pseudomonadota bacterium]
MRHTILILGRSITARLAACYLRQTLPDVDVLILGPAGAKLPVVGESTIEISAFFLQELGLLSYLSANHVHKIGLSFYFKEKLEDAADRRYAVHEPPAMPPLPSFQLNRFTLADKLRDLCSDLGVRVIDGKATDIERVGRANVRVPWRDRTGRNGLLSANWVLDCTGRARFLARSLGLQRQASVQRSAFWVRLGDFDRNFLGKLESVKQRQCSYDSYYVTHHFFGKGNWIWLIPLQGEDGRPILSVGITWRPDLFAAAIRSVDDFIDQCDREHPVVADLLRNSHVLDSNVYLNYMYESTRVYSSDGWFVLGDAGNTVDPLYSTGLAFTAMQIHHVTEMIRQDMRGTLRPSLVADFEALYFDCVRTVQRNVTEQYTVMHRAYENHWYVHLLTAANYYVVLPSILAGYHTDQVGARLMSRLFTAGSDGFRSLIEAAAHTAARLGEVKAESLHNNYEKAINWDLRGQLDPGQVGRYYARFLALNSRFRYQLMKSSRLAQAGKQARLLATETALGGLFGGVLAGRSLLDSVLIRRMTKLPRGSESALPAPRPINAEADIPGQTGLTTRLGRTARPLRAV